MPASRRRAVKAKPANRLARSALQLSGVPYRARAYPTLSDTRQAATAARRDSGALIVRSARVPRDGAGRRPAAVSEKWLERFRLKRMRSRGLSDLTGSRRSHLPLPPPPRRRGNAGGAALLSLSAPGGGEGRGEVGESRPVLREIETVRRPGAIPSGRIVL